MRSSLLVVTLALLVVGTFADVYMHNPRGSNNRNRELNTNRENAERLFNSQNNDKGGYCWGPAMSYYEGSLLSLEWTAQHGCGNPRLYCNIVFQYMCTDTTKTDGLTMIRDGLNQTEIPVDDATRAAAVGAGGEYAYGLHEPFSYYQECRTRKRNKGLFIADRGLGTDTSITTRQNNGGTQHGTECPEERDYYPYWYPSPWKDIAILTHDTKSCGFYQKESENVKPRWYCASAADGKTPAPEIQQNLCEKSGNVWVKGKSHDLPAPDCIQAPTSRENHLGNGGSMHFPLTYNWTLPTSGQEDCIKKDNCNCVLRIRYNISQMDLGETGNNPDAGFIDYRSNGDQSPVKNDPTVTATGVPLELALATNQLGRTFQDRSHTFHIRPRPSKILDTARIYNLNVRGKRGNIVEVYPSVEYDFVPSYLQARVGDYIHYQWTGCDTNPDNTGEGKARTDRSNIVQVASPNLAIPVKDDWYKDNTPLFEDPKLRFRMAYLDQNPALCNNETNDQQNDQNCKKLNAASAYFDAGLVKVNSTGEFHYISTRNNNFSNRDQRGTINIAPVLPVWGVAIVSIGSALFVGGGAVAGAMFYAKSHPHSQVANLFNKF